MSNAPHSMTPNQPYMLRAIYEWIADNHMTPYILVNADYPNIHVPKAFVRENKIIFNIAEKAVRKLLIGNEAVEFEARFGGVAQRIYIPIAAVMAIYAYENGAGMAFSAEQNEALQSVTVETHDDAKTASPAWRGEVVASDKGNNTAVSATKSKAELRLIKNEDKKD